jgi:hypothetical protein
MAEGVAGRLATRGPDLVVACFRGRQARSSCPEIKPRQSYPHPFQTLRAGRGDRHLHGLLRLYAAVDESFDKPLPAHLRRLAWKYNRK